ncbi:MAG: DNA polymerase III subunit [Planctomycetes bacterium]|nr:DNA polymerase III subunit [Planctomycetota bacterium]
MPWSLADMLGQEPVLDRLRREFAANRAAHAYMFESPPGTGKTTLARGLAAWVLCADPAPDGAACGACRPCHMLQNGNHPDYLELPRDTAELRIARFINRERAGSTETVDHPPVLPFLRMKPVEGARRLAVIPDAERMRPESANAFLKTLEEPPGDALIILTVNSRDRLPATIASRCRRIGLMPLSTETVRDELIRRTGLPPEDAAELAVAAEGSLGVGLSLAQGEVVEFWRWLDGEAFSRPGAFEAERLADGWKRFGSGGGDNAGKRKNALAALDLSALALRRLLRRDGPPAERVAKALDVLYTAADQIVKNVKPDLVLLGAAFEIMAILKG